MKYFLGIDGGGTQTRAAIVTASLDVVGRGGAGPGNHYRVGASVAAQNCAQAATEALADAARIAPDISREDIAAWGFGLAGVRRAVDIELMQGHVAIVATGQPWVMDTDATAAHAGALNGAPGIVLIGGTGAITLGIDEAGERFYGDGWGPLLGDEGSGYWMGQEALRAVCRAHDGRAPRSNLSQSVLSALDIADMEQLVPLVHSSEMTPDRMASLSRIVLDLAQNGVAAALEIRDRAVSLLGQTVAATARAMLNRARERAGLNPPEPLDLSISLHGGLFSDDYFRASVGYAIGERLVEMKRDYLPLNNWKVVKPHFDPAIGAALLAQKYFLAHQDGHNNSFPNLQHRVVRES